MQVSARQSEPLDSIARWVLLAFQAQTISLPDVWKKILSPVGRDRLKGASATPGKTRVGPSIAILRVRNRARFLRAALTESMTRLKASVLSEADLIYTHQCRMRLETYAQYS
jgi:hypothetical protein